MKSKKILIITLIIILVLAVAGTVFAYLFIATDTFLYQNGYTKVVTDKLDEMGIVHETFFDVAPDPTLACAKEGAQLIDAYSSM